MRTPVSEDDANFERTPGVLAEKMQMLASMALQKCLVKLLISEAKGFCQVTKLLVSTPEQILR
jgi:hypothetical protein